MLEMNPAEANGDQGLPGLAGGLPWGQGGGPHAQDRSSQSYYEHDYDSFLAVLKRNSKKLQVDPARREPEPRAEFEGSMGKLLPLMERIRLTDELIDATVYRLYGLTEEEIGIVEGKA